jgi:arylsulfatase A
MDRRDARRCLRWGFGLGLALCLAPGAAAAADAAAKPNVVFILIDDLGWADVACYGSTFHETPEIDRLARQGMRFTDAYAACCVCSPTRASILTGKYPARLHLTNWIKGFRPANPKLLDPDWTMHLRHEEVTLAEALKPAGYASAAVGKWHLGDAEYRPETQGFDLNVGGDHRGQPPTYFSPFRIPGVPDGKPGDYLTDRLTDEAEKFMEANRDRPFFLYLSHYAVHTPLQAKKDLTEKYQAKVKPESAQRNAVYAAMIDSVDESVGRVMRKLDALRIADRTAVFFTSDNGGLASVTSNAPLRAGKGSPWEGGVREPLIVAWPGVVKPGSVCNAPVSSVDYYPTILEMAGAAGDPRHNAAVDGESIVPLLKQTGSLKRSEVFWHFPHYHGGGATPYGAVRQGDYKLVEFYEDGRVELYNLKDDIGERRDLAGQMPEKAAALRRRLEGWRRDVGAQMPAPNPKHAAGGAEAPANKRERK